MARPWSWWRCHSSFGIHDRGVGQHEEGARELFETVKIYNAVPPEAEASYREALLREYAAFCQKEKKP